MKLVVKCEGELLDYLYNNLDMPKKRIKQYLTHGAIYVNNNKTTKYNYKVVPGMKIVIDTDSKGKVELPFDILFEDDHIIVVNKPSGLLTIATDKEKEKTLYHIVREYLVSKDRNAKVFIVHRLDKDTSGLVVFAKSEILKRKLQNNWERTKRGYVAVLNNHLPKEKGTVKSYLKETKTLLVYSTNDKSGDLAITDYQELCHNKKYTLVKINLKTGRKNQIRVHMNDLGCPILGDKKYGGIKTDPLRRLCLYANYLEFINPLNNKRMVFNLEIPNEFLELTK